MKHSVEDHSALCWTRGRRICRRVRMAANIIGACWALIAGTSAVAWARGRPAVPPDALAAFKAAIELQKSEEWDHSTRRLQEALSHCDQESTERIHISRRRNPHYLPHYYLGLALARLGKCEDAEREWGFSVEARAIIGTDEYDELQQERANCLGSKPRPARARART